MRSEASASFWDDFLVRLRFIYTPRMVRKALLAAGHGDVLLAGAITPRLAVKMLMTLCVPFCVSFYGAYAAYRNALAEQRHAAGRA